MIRYQKYKVQDIYKYFINGLKLPSKVRLLNWTAHHDPSRMEIIFELITDEEDKYDKTR